MHESLPAIVRHFPSKKKRSTRQISEALGLAVVSKQEKKQHSMKR